jgi:hypothetical protein
MQHQTMRGPIRWGEPSPGADRQRPVVIASHVSVGGAKQTHAAARVLKQTSFGERGRAERELAAASDAGERPTPQLPVHGDRGPAGGRSWKRLPIEPDRATWNVLAVAYPCLAEEGLGSAGVLVRQKYWTGTANCHDPAASSHDPPVSNNAGKAAP